MYSHANLNSISSKVDIFSLGTIIYQMVSQESLYLSIKDLLVLDKNKYLTVMKFLNSKS